MVKLGSLFDGIGGFTLSALKNGMTPVWASEIDEKCIELTTKKFPTIKHIGSVCDIVASNIEPVDIITFGSPCQNLSMAGNRKGFNGEQSVLFLEAIRIIDEMREITNGEYPKIIIWENVTGAFTSNSGEDFKTVLEEVTKSKIPMPKSSKWANAGMVGSHRCNVEWRVFDSEYWGVPQCRERIFLVADFTKRSRGKILFERQGFDGDKEKVGWYEKRCATYNEKNVRTTGEGKHITSTLFAAYGTKWNGNNGAYIGSHFVLDGGRLRRLTPTECEGLMGFPVGWTEGYRDTVRYRMLGNSVVTPCVDFIMKNTYDVLSK